MPPQTESKAVDFVVERSNLRHAKFVPAVAAGEIELQPGQALLRVASFAFTANNVTYAVAGDMLSYWSFFPAEEGWGRIPVWGFADVLHSRQEGVAEGERVFGYLPMSTHLVVQPGRVSRAGFLDVSPHRAALPAVYNQYTRTANDPGYDPAREDEQMLFRPLFMTAFLLDDSIADNGFFGARTVVLSSASSKTAFGLAFLLHRRSGCDVVGLTSAGNVPFVESLGCYDRILTYDRIGTLAADVPAVFVDMAGNGTVASAVHRHFGANLKHSAIVGATHWERGERDADLPGAQPAFFFAPTQLEKRTKEWGPDGLQKRYASAWGDFLAMAKSHVRVEHGRGQADVERVYGETLEGRSRPDVGHVLSL
jgi:Protein of unknown function (DUF2855)